MKRIPAKSRTKRGVSAVISGIVVASLAGCAHAPAPETAQVQTCTPHQVADGSTPECTFRRVEWLEGAVQTGYEPDRTVAEEKLKQAEAGAPDPSNTEKYLEYLSVLDASGRVTKAEAEIKKYLAVHPKDSRAIFLLGVHYMRLKKRDLAKYFFTQLEKDGKFAAKSLLFNNLGMLALHDGERAQALEYFEKATKASPPTAAPFVNLGALYLQSHSYADAEKMFQQAHELDGDFEDAVLGWGSALEGQGKFDDAHQVYASFMSGHADALSVLFNDATILGNRLKQKELAAQEMLRYIQRGGRESAKAHENIQNWK